MQRFPIVILLLILFLTSCQQKKKTATVPFILDHNRMIVEGEIQSKDGTWRKVRLWVDTGSARFFISQSLAMDIGFTEVQGQQNGYTPKLRLGDFILNTGNTAPVVNIEPFWIYNAMHIDGNLPANILKDHHVVFDYANKQLTIGEPGSMKPKGSKISAAVHPLTGIAQLYTVMGGDSLNFALDLGASYSYMSDSIVNLLMSRDSALPSVTGTTGHANMWGWWPPQEDSFLMTRFPFIQCGDIKLEKAGFVGVPKNPSGGKSLSEWYSQKTLWPVVGFLGANIFKSCRVEIDYLNQAVYLEKIKEYDGNDMDLVPLAISSQRDSTFNVIGVASKNGNTLVKDILKGDKILQIDSLKTKGNTMGTVMDALRGNPGDNRRIVVARDGKEVIVDAKVERVM